MSGICRLAVGQRASADPVGLVPGDPEHAQQVFGDPIGGLGVVAVGLVVQQLSEAERGARGDGQRELRVGDGEPACPRGRCNAGPRHRFPLPLTITTTVAGCINVEEILRAN